MKKRYVICFILASIFLFTGCTQLNNIKNTITKSQSNTNKVNEASKDTKEKNKLTAVYTVSMLKDGSGSINITIGTEGSAKKYVSKDTILNTLMKVNTKSSKENSSTKDFMQLKTEEIPFKNLEELNALFPKENTKNVTLNVSKMGSSFLSDTYGFSFNIPENYISETFNISDADYKNIDVKLSVILKVDGEIVYANTGENDNKTLRWDFSNDTAVSPINIRAQYMLSHSFNEMIIGITILGGILFLFVLASTSPS